MKKIFLSIVCLLMGIASYAQHIYQIRADSVRIYNTCDTAELILENHTQDTLGFLFNKWKGRTEFRKLRLVPVGDTAVALPGQDTLSLRALMWSGGLSRGLIITGDADYLIPREVGVVVLRDITISRKITLPAPESNRNREIVILDKTTGNYRWWVKGAFVPRDMKGTPPYLAKDSLTISKGDKLILFSDGNKWYDLNVCAAGANKAPTVNAGKDTTLPAGSTQTTMNGSVTPGSSNYYTSIWTVISQPSGSPKVNFTDSSKVNTGVSNLTGGSYVFVITVTDQLGLTAKDTVKVLVPMPSQMFSSGGPNDNVYDTTNGNKTWVYLPDGYDPNSNPAYPLIIFLHGGGENGTDISKVLNPFGGLPIYLYNKSFPMQSVVIAPQSPTPNWSKESIKAAYDYAVKNYHVDVDRVYVTGLSFGGGASCLAVASYPSLFAAYISISPTDNDLQRNGIIAKNIGAYYVQDFIDPYVPSTITWDCINTINSASPKGLYPPQIKMLTIGDHEPTIWNQTVYDKTKASFDFEKDFFLLYNRKPELTAANFVTRAEEKEDYTEYSKALILVQKLPASTDKTALEQRLRVLLQRLTEYYRYYVIDPGVASNTPVPNTNKITDNTPGTIINGLKDIKGSTYPLSFKVVSASVPTNFDDGLDNDYMGLDHTIYKDGAVIDATGATYAFGGLSDNSGYDIRIYHANRNTDKTTSSALTATVNGANVSSGYAAWNTNDYVDVTNVKSTGGVINLTLKSRSLSNLPAGQSAIVAIVLKEKPGPQPGNRAQFNFSKTPQNVPGWTSAYGNFTQNVQVFTDNPTGWVLSTVSTANWGTFYQGYAADDNGMSTGDFSTDFPADVVRSHVMNGFMKFDGSNYGLEIKGSNGQGLPAGKYQVKLISSIKSSVDRKGQAFVNVKFGGRSNQLQYVYPTDNTNNYVTFNGQIQAGETIKVSINRADNNYSDVAFISGLIIEKIN